LAIQIIARAREAFQVELPLRALFEAPTIAELSERVEDAMRSGDAPIAPALSRAPRDGELPLSFSQERLWLLWQLDPEDTAYLVPIVIRLVGALDVGALERALREIVRRHEVLRTTYATAS